MILKLKNKCSLQKDYSNIRITLDEDIDAKVINNVLKVSRIYILLV